MRTLVGTRCDQLCPATPRNLPLPSHRLAFPLRCLSKFMSALCQTTRLRKVEEEAASQAKALAAAEGQIESLKNECAARTREIDASNREFLLPCSQPLECHLSHVSLGDVFCYRFHCPYCPISPCSLLFASNTGIADEAKKEMAEMKKRMLDAFKEAERVAELERLLSSTRHDADRNQVGAAAEEMLLICAEMPMFHRSLRSSNPYSPYDRLIIIVLAHACVLYVILYEQGCAAQRCGGTAADKTSRRQTDCDIGLPLPPLLNRPPSEPSSSRTCEPSIHFCSLPFPLHVPL